MAKGDKFGGGGTSNYSGWSPEVQSYVNNMGNWRASAGNAATYGDMGHYAANQSVAQGENLYRQRQAIEWANQQKMSDPAYWAQAFGMGGGAAPTNQYETRLNSLMDNPDSIAKSGVYKFAFDQGNEAVNRNMAAKGLLKSGNRLGELTKFGQGLASQQYGNEANRLASLASSRYAVDAQSQNQMRAMAMEAAMKNAAPRTYQTPSGTLTRWN